MGSNYFSNALAITLKHKSLWLLGILAGLQFGYSASGPDLSKGGAWLLVDFARYLNPTSLWAVLATVASICLWLCGLLARAALIQSVWDIKKLREPLGLVTSLRQNIGSLFSLVIMQLIVWSPVIILSPILFGQYFSLFNGIPHSRIFITRFGSIWIAGIAMILLSIALGFVDAFAFRSIVLGRLNPFQGISNGLKGLGYSWYDAVIAAIGCGILGIIVGFLIGIPFAFVASIVFESFLAFSSSSFLIPILFGLIGALLSSIWIVFQSVVFTLIFIERVGILPVGKL